MSLRCGTTAGNSSRITFGTSVATLQSDESISVWFRLNTTPAAFNTLVGRKVRHATDGSSLKNWGVMLNDGTQPRLQATFFSGGSQIDIIPQTSGTGTGVGTDLSNSVWYHMLLVRDGANNQVRIEVNGPSLSVIQTATVSSINNNTVQFYLGADPEQAGVGAPVDVAECEIVSSVLASGSGATLYNAGIANRVRDSFSSVTVSNYWDMFQIDTSTVVDKAGSADGTCSTITAPSATFIDHPPMAGPIMDFRANAGVFSDSGTTPAVNGDRVQQWSDQSGRRLHLVQTTAANKPRYNTGASFKRPGVHFDKFEFPAGTTVRRTLPFPTNCRFNTRDASIAIIYQNTSGTFNTGAGNTDFYTLASFDGAGNGVTEVGRRAGGDDIGGILRVGSSFGTGPGDAIFVPSNPSLIITIGLSGSRTGYVNGGGTHKEGAIGTAYSVTGSTGQGAIGDNTGAATDLCANGTFEAVRIWNRQLGSTDRSNVTAWATGSYGVITSPAGLDFGIGSSSIGGNGSTTNRGLMHRLYHESGILNNRWMFNFGNSSSSLYNDAAAIPSTTRFNENTVEQIIADFAGPSVPVRVFDWTGSNDLTDSRTTAQIIADKKTMIDALRVDCNAVGATLEVIQVAVLPTDVHSGAQNTERIALNAALRTPATAAGYWTKVVSHDLDAGLLTTNATNWGNEGAPSYRHLNDTGKGVSFPYWKRLFGGGGGYRGRGRKRNRATAV
jgi:hypothetical protein